jgi:hypothetical protein
VRQSLEWYEKTYVPIQKECRRCQEVRHWTDFKRWSLNKDGLDHTCEICYKEELNELKEITDGT